MKKLSKKEYEKLFVAEFFEGRSSQEAYNLIKQEIGFTFQNITGDLEAQTISSQDERRMDY